MISPRWRSVALVAAALAPFAPAVLQAVQLGVPADLLIGDAAVLELRTLQAAHGIQFLGPYSRFYWSHPGPAFFYLALPLYEALGERGLALHLAALLLNVAAAVAIVVTARRLRGEAFAWMVAAGLAVIVLAALPELPANPWNPFTPVLPLVLLSLLAARLALGHLSVAPVFAFVASAIVQTHVGFGPVTAALMIVAVVSRFANRKGLRHGMPVGRAFMARRWVPIATAVVLIVCWALPLYEGVTGHPSNITRLWHFFKSGNPDAPAWGTVIATLRYQLVMLPFVGAALVFAARRKDTVLRMLAVIAAVEVVVAVFAVRSIRGELHPYLLYWLAAPSFMTWAVAAAWVVRAPWRHTVAAVVVAASIIGIVVAAPLRAWRLYPEKNPAAERAVVDVEHFIRSQGVKDPLIRVASADAWPLTAALMVHLRKQGTPFLVEPGWTFMFGTEREDRGAEHPLLLVGNRAFCDRAAAERLRSVAEAGDICVYFDSPRDLAAQRLPPPAIRLAVSVMGNANRLVDDIVPTPGSAWNSAQTVILASTSSWVTVAVPQGNVSGFFMSADGNDRYAVRCVGGDRSWEIGPKHPDDGLVGMHTMRLFSDDMSACAAVTVQPISGDGSYSIGEIGFLHPL